MDICDKLSKSSIFPDSVIRQNVVTDMFTICQQHGVSIVIVCLPNARFQLLQNHINWIHSTQVLWSGNM